MYIKRNLQIYKLLGAAVLLKYSLVLYYLETVYIILKYKCLMQN